MKNTKILLAGPGTGKTRRITDDFIAQEDPDNILVLSFTNATIDGLLKSFKDKNISITEKNCMTLSKYALKINHFSKLHILNQIETGIIKNFSKKVEIDLLKVCEQFNSITFGQMIEKSVDFIKNNPEYIKDKIGNTKLLIVDEFQDFNYNERELISLISDNVDTTLILGDDDQSIYGFKDADPEGIIELYNDITIGKIEHENICYRCPGEIVEASNNLIQNNKMRVDKVWKKSNNNKGLTPKQFRNNDDCFKFISEEIIAIKNKEPSSSVMVLSPITDLLKQFENSLQTNKIEYVNWNSNISDINELINLWTLKIIFGSNKPLNLLFLIKNNFVNLTEKKKKFFYDSLKEYLFGHINDIKFIEILVDILNISELNEYSLNQPTVEKLIERYPIYEKYFELLKNEIDREERLEKYYLTLNSKTEFSDKKVNLMTIHKSKGLQADYVFLLGMVNGILPNESKGLDSLESQRRELFVGMSRAIKNLYILSVMEWEGRLINNPYLADKNKFNFNYKSKNYIGEASLFIREFKI